MFAVPKDEHYQYLHIVDRYMFTGYGRHTKLIEVAVYEKSTLSVVLDHFVHHTCKLYCARPSNNEQLQFQTTAQLQASLFTKG